MIASAARSANSRRPATVLGLHDVGVQDVLAGAEELFEFEAAQGYERNHDRVAVGVEAEENVRRSFGLQHVGTVLGKRDIEHEGVEALELVVVGGNLDQCPVTLLKEQRQLAEHPIPFREKG